MKQGAVLLADDDRSIRTVLSQALTRMGARVRATGSVNTLWRWVEDGEGDVIVTDVVMPDGDALEMLPAIRKRRPDLPVIVMSARNNVLTAIRSTEAGAYEYLPKPFDLKQVLALVRKAMDSDGEAAPVTRKAEEPLPLIGRSPAMQEVYRVISRLTGVDLAVLISGESGVGKGLVARTLHEFGRRRAGPFVTINLAATPAERLEAELFGGAEGALAAAAGGTLFLDEIGDMPLDAQGRLLRVLKDREAEGGRPSADAFRVIASTHRDLPALIGEGEFREDLFYRLNVVPLRLPALRERIEDVPDLARHFLARAHEEGLPRRALSGEAADALRARRWGGNVRELANLMRRLAALSADEVIDEALVAEELASRPSSAADPDAAGAETLGGAVERCLQRYFAFHGDGAPPPGLYQRVLREVETPLIALTIDACHGNQIRAADILGINRNTLRKKVRELDITVTRGKKLM